MWRRFGPFLLGVLLVIFMMLITPRAGHPHEACIVLDPAWVEARTDGYHVAVRALGWAGQALAVPTRTEIVPYSEAQPSPDGDYWRCQRAGGARRSFFAPGPGS